MENNYAKINNACLVILALVAITIALIYTRPILVPFVISFFIYAIISPAINWFQVRLKMPRYLAMTVTIVSFFVTFALLVFFISTSLKGFFDDALVYKKRIVEFYKWSFELAQSYGFELKNIDIIEELKNLPIFSFAKNITTGVTLFFGNMILVMIFVLFFLIGEGVAVNQNPMVDTIKLSISRYAAAKFFLSLVTGALVFIILLIFGIELAFLFGVLTLFLNFIPNIGSLTATLFPIPIILLQYGFGWEILVILILCITLQFVIGNILEPKLMGESMDLHPITILLFLMFWGLVWGIPGMFMAIPITAIMKIIFSRIETTRGLAEVLAGRL